VRTLREMPLEGGEGYLGHGRTGKRASGRRDGNPR